MANFENAPLFGLSYCCDEGFNGFSEVFQAESREVVLTYMLKEIKSYVRWARKNPNAKWNEIPAKYTKGDKYFRILRCADWNPRVNGKSIGFELIYETQEERKDAAQRFILKASPKELAHIIDNSQVDGDSSFQITLTEIKVTVDLT
jgi:hypothetical protein